MASAIRRDPKWNNIPWPLHSMLRGICLRLFHRTKCTNVQWDAFVSTHTFADTHTHTRHAKVISKSFEISIEDIYVRINCCLHRVQHKYMRACHVHIPKARISSSSTAKRSWFPFRISFFAAVFRKKSFENSFPTWNLLNSGRCVLRIQIRCEKITKTEHTSPNALVHHIFLGLSAGQYIAQHTHTHTRAADPYHRNELRFFVGQCSECVCASKNVNKYKCVALYVP